MSVIFVENGAKLAMHWGCTTQLIINKLSSCSDQSAVPSQMMLQTYGVGEQEKFSGSLKCDVCGKRCKTSHSLKMHYSIYHKIKQYWNWRGTFWMKINPFLVQTWMLFWTVWCQKSGLVGLPSFAATPVVKLWRKRGTWKDTLKATWICLTTVRYARKYVPPVMLWGSITTCITEAELSVSV